MRLVASAVVVLVVAPAVAGRRSQTAQAHARTRADDAGEDAVGVVVDLGNLRLRNNLPLRTGGTWAEPNRMV